MLVITGGVGYIGGHVLLHLLDHHPDQQVALIDNASPANWAWLAALPKAYQQRITCCHGSILDEAWLTRTLVALRPRAVIHLAALSVVEASMGAPLAYMTTNVEGTLKVAKACVAAECQRLVFSSSAAVYGAVPYGQLVAVERQPEPTTPYGWSKYLAEQTLKAIATTTALNVHVLRYFNVRGTDRQGRHTENHNPETHLWPNLLAAAGSGQVFQLYQAPQPTPDSSCVRDYVWIDEIARQSAQAALRPTSASESAAFTVAHACTGQPTTALQLLAQAEQHTGQPITWQLAAPRPGDVAWLVGQP